MNLSVEHINKSFENTRVLDDVTLDIQKGEILSLTGESGCGKSTLLRIISGLEMPDSGRIILNDEEITNWSPEKRKFGFVFQNLSLFPHLTVRDNIFYAIRKKDQSNSKLTKLTDMTGLKGLATRYPHELSGGQQQRVALARALAINPQLLILDEPFSSLDELLKAKIREEIFDLLRTLEITTILVSHQASDAFLIANKLIVMRQGKIQQVGRPADVYQNPISPYVSDFFGASVILTGKNVNDNSIHTSFGTLKIANDRVDDLQLFVRPENIKITTLNDYNLSGRILKKEFKGPHDVLRIGSENSNEYISLETERCMHEVGETIYLKVPEELVQIFK
ncbi:ABC transporter ATP-binding protein [Ekhidna sp.]|uniref:ABC transporter ATP-binding protein n=1 Tax=Ekhidna sp. TaxID=2608089 RepID=UPI00329A578F